MLDLQFSGSGAPNLGTAGGEQTMAAEFILQIGFLMLLPLFAEEALEFGLRNAIGNQIRQQLSLRLLYPFFQERTKAAISAVQEPRDVSRGVPPSLDAGLDYSHRPPRGTGTPL